MQGVRLFEIVRRRPLVLPLACTLIALVRRSSGWDPPSLWLDDQWLALAVRYASLDRLYQLRIPSPFGFSVLQKWAAGWASDREWPLQTIPFLAGLATVPATYFVARRVVRRPELAGLACLIAACHPIAELYATRVKHYSLDVLIALGLWTLFIGLLQRPSPRRLALLAGGGLIAALFSFASLFVTAAGLHALCIDRLVRARTVAEPAGARVRLRRDAIPYCAAAMAFDVAALVLYHFVLAGQSSAAMQAYWAKYFLDTGDVASVFSFFVRSALGLPWHAVSPWFLVLLWPVYAGIRGLLRDPVLRPLVWAAGLVYVAQLTAAVFHVYPMGDPRTSLFAYPVVWILAAAGVEALLQAAVPRGLQQRALQVAIAVVVLAALCRPRVEYSESRDRQAVEQLLPRLRESDGMLMLPFGQLALAYYGARPVELRPSIESAHNFEASPDYPNLFVLPLEIGGRSVRAHPELAAGPLEQLYAHRYPRLFFLSTHATAALDRSILEDAERHGYHQAQTFQTSGQAALYLLDRMVVARRPAPSAIDARN